MLEIDRETGTDLWMKAMAIKKEMKHGRSLFISFRKELQSLLDQIASHVTSFLMSRKILLEKPSLLQVDTSQIPLPV
jgi:hypothetical protein